MIIHNYVSDYLEWCKVNEKYINVRRKKLFKLLYKNVLNNDALYFDEEQINKCVGFIERWYFKLEPFQKFIICFMFLKVKETGRLYYKDFFINVGRGNGKNGLISGLSNYFISPMHAVKGYNGAVVANSEDQAKTSFEEIYNKIEYDKPDPLKKIFRPFKSVIECPSTQSKFQVKSSGGKTKDSFRHGFLIFDEVHEYEDFKIINTLSSGFGKVPFRRRIFITTNGHVRDGVFDMLLERIDNVLDEQNEDDRIFPFICELDNRKEADNSTLWQKANPMFCEPKSQYAQELFEVVKDEYLELPTNPSNKYEFYAKRMNLPETDLSMTVAPWEEIKACKRQIPFDELKNRTCIGGLDYSEVRDFTAVGLLFKYNNEYIWHCHSFVTKEFLDTHKLKAPIDDWIEEGLITVIEEPVINMKQVVGWFEKQRELYDLSVIISDNFRLSLVKSELEGAGFELLYIKNPKAIHNLLVPKVETLFANRQIVFGKKSMMPWYTQNVLVKVDKQGSKTYEKKEPKLRKTDGFQAFIHALWQADNYLLDDDIGFYLDDIDF